MGKWIHYEHPEIWHHLMDRAMKQSTRQFPKIFFHVSICFACNAEKVVLYWMTQNKNGSINSIMQHGRVVNKSCFVVFPTLGNPYLTLCPRQCKWKVATTYLAIRTKNKWNIWVWKSPAVKASTDCKKQHRTLQSMRKNRNNNFIIFIRSISR